LKHVLYKNLNETEGLRNLDAHGGVQSYGAGTCYIHVKTDIAFFKENVFSTEEPGDVFGKKFLP
jgi:hypothetical protein